MDDHPVAGRAAAALFLLTVLVAAVPARAAAVTITAAALTTDATGRVVATGNVRVSDGTTVAQGNRAVLDPERRTAVLTPGTVRSPQGRLQAREITVRYTPARVVDVTARGEVVAEFGQTRVAADRLTLRLAEEVATAAGRVRLTLAPTLRVEGTEMTYRHRTGRVEVRGPVVRSPEGTATARNLEGRRDGQEVRLHGAVRMRLGRTAAQADEATWHAADRRVILVGNVRVEQNGRVLWGTRVTVDYAAGRIVAEGPLRLRIADPAGSP